MNFSLSQIVSSDELNIDAELISDKLKDTPEILLFSENKPQFVIMSLEQYDLYTSPKQFTKTIPSKDNTTNSTDHNIKIGVFVKNSMRKLLSENLLPLPEIRNLTDAEYCSAVFGLSYPVLKEYDSSRPFDEQKRDANNKYNRYYNFTLNSSYGQYLLCSQWVEQLHRYRFEKWLSMWI